MPLNPGPWVSCSCRYMKVQTNTAVKYGDDVHRADGPCFTLTQPNTTSKDNSQMEFTKFVRKPFNVEAVQITAENIAEVAKHVGDLRQKEDGTPFILVDRRLVPNVTRVYVGFWMTKMGENVRCYSQKIFREQFTESDESIQQWVDFLNSPKAKTGG